MGDGEKMAILSGDDRREDKSLFEDSVSHAGHGTELQREYQLEPYVSVSMIGDHDGGITPVSLLLTLLQCY